MKWASAISMRVRLREAVNEALEGVMRQLDSQLPDLVFVFLSREFGPHHERLRILLREGLGDAPIFGCTASGIIGAGREVEQQPAIAITAAVLPDVAVSAVHLEATDLPPIYAERVAWEGVLGVKADIEPHFLIISDPFSFDTEKLLRGLDRAYPQAVKIGGLASGARELGGNLLLSGEKAWHSGAVVLSLAGDVHVETIVAQGCRPVGEPMFITGCHGNLLRELDGRVPRDVLTDLYEKLPARDKQLVESSLFIGMAMPGERPRLQPGEFLIRNVIGMDAQSGALWVAAELQQNSVIQFHVRDAISSAEDLEHALGAADREERARTKGVLLFSCVGRGSRFYGSADHDSNVLRKHLGEPPIGGFFCSGEIGQVQGMAQVHGYTSSVALFSPKMGLPAATRRRQ